MSIEINGIAHIHITANDPEVSIPFWQSLCHFLGLKTLIHNEDTIYCIGGRTGILVRAAPVEKRGQTFDQDTVGLHHFCFRTRSAEDVDRVHEFIKEDPGAKVIHAPEAGDQFAPGYYSLLFEDPDGIRVEFNYIPGKGHFGGRGRLTSGGEGAATQYDEDGLLGRSEG